MARTRNKLTSRQVETLGPGAYGDGGGLWLRVTKNGSRQWIYRFRHLGRARQMGLGGADKVPLARARLFRDEYEAMTVEGVNPIEERRKRNAKAISEQVTLQEVAEAAFEARKAELKGDGKAGRWFSPLALHVLPKLGQRPIVSISQTDIKYVIEPIWHSKAATARKAIDRLNIVMKHAVAMGLDVDIQAVAKAKVLLGRQRHKVKHIDGMPWEEVPAFYASLTELTPVQLALRFLILNPGPRSKPLRYLRPEHIDGDVWTIPEEGMKGRRGYTPEWRTPLSEESLQIVELAKSLTTNEYLFPNVRGRGVISDASMSRLMERRGLEYRPHGFRSSFKTWATEQGHPRDITELCMAHKIHDKVEAAYLRTDQLAARHELMKAWATFCNRNAAITEMMLYG